MKKFISLLIIFNITASLLMSGTCGGQIDAIFMGWRDLSGCNTSCMGFYDQRDDTGVVIVLALLLIVFALCIALHRLLNKKNPRAVGWLHAKVTRNAKSGDTLIALDALEVATEDAPNFPSKKITINLSLKNGRLVEQK